MKPIVNEGDYLVSIFNTEDDEIKQIHVKQGLNFSVAVSEEMIRHYPAGYSYRVMRCLKNSKYNIHSPGPKT